MPDAHIHLEQMKITTAKSLLTNPREFFLIVRIMLFLLFLPVMVRSLSIQSLVMRVTPSRDRTSIRGLSLDRVIYLCERCLRLLQGVGYRYSCLRRSIVLYHFLRAEGVPVMINFGVQWQGERLLGHSWLTLDKSLYLEEKKKVDQFVSFFSLPFDSSGGKESRESQKGEFIDLEHASFD